MLVTVTETIAETLLHLTPKEQTVYTHLALHQKRLEQERISQDYANLHLQNLIQHSI